MVLAVPDRLKAGTARAREVFDEYEPAAEDSDMPVAPSVFKRFDYVKRAYDNFQKYQAELQKEQGKSRPKKSRVAELQRSQQRAHKKLVKTVRECSLSQRFIAEVV